jgi:prolipoprotein diacylglyceryltransferase
VQPESEDVLAGLTLAQVLSVAMMLAGATWIAVIARRGKLAREPADVTALQPQP